MSGKEKPVRESRSDTVCKGQSEAFRSGPMEHNQIRLPGSENSRSFCFCPTVLNSFCPTTRLPLPVPRFCEPLPRRPPVAIPVKPVLTRQGGFASSSPLKRKSPQEKQPHCGLLASLPRICVCGCFANVRRISHPRAAGNVFFRESFGACCNFSRYGCNFWRYRRIFRLLDKTAEPLARLLPWPRASGILY